MRLDSSTESTEMVSSQNIVWVGWGDLRDKHIFAAKSFKKKSFKKKGLLYCIHLIRNMALESRPRHEFFCQLFCQLTTEKSDSLVQYFAVSLHWKIRPLQGSLTKDFRLQVFFLNQFPAGPWVPHWGYCEFLRKFAEIFTTLCLSLITMTPAIIYHR